MGRAILKRSDNQGPFRETTPRNERTPMPFEAAVHAKAIQLDTLALEMCAEAGSGHPDGERFRLGPRPVAPESQGQQSEAQASQRDEEEQGEGA